MRHPVLWSFIAICVWGAFNYDLFIDIWMEIQAILEGMMDDLLYALDQAMP